MACVRFFPRAKPSKAGGFRPGEGGLSNTTQSARANPRESSKKRGCCGTCVYVRVCFSLSLSLSLSLSVNCACNPTARARASVKPRATHAATLKRGVARLLVGRRRQLVSRVSFCVFFVDAAAACVALLLLSPQGAVVVAEGAEARRIAQSALTERNCAPPIISAPRTSLR